MHALLLAVMLNAGPVDFTWGTGPQGLKKLVATPDATLLQQVLACAKGYGVKTIERRGEKVDVVWSAADAATDTLAGVSKAERVALLSLMGRQARGSEFDLLIPQPDGTFIPVTAWWDTPEVVGFASGPAWSPVDVPVTVEQLREKYKVGEFLEADSKWDAKALAAIGQALATLSAEELALVPGLKFRRARTAGGKHAALYQRGDATNLIEVYDAAFSLDGEQFVGTPTAPRSYLLLPLLHELGHAIADARMRELGIANLALRAKWEAAKAENKGDTTAAFEAANGGVKKLLAIDAANSKGRPAERELATVFPQNRSPTPYGRTKPAEHFAESFTLWKNDRAALARISPEAAAWFDAGKHVAIAGAAIDK